MTDALALLVVLAQDAPRNTGPDFGKASPVGLIVIVLLLLGTFALVWSMNRHLRKLPTSFRRDQTEPEPTAIDERPEPQPEEPGRDPG